MGELSNLPNIGKRVEELLNEAGIMTENDLKAAGAKQAWLKIQEIDESACIHKLLALEGAIRHIPKRMLPELVRADLKTFCQQHKKEERT